MKTKAEEMINILHETYGVQVSIPLDTAKAIAVMGGSLPFGVYTAIKDCVESIENNQQVNTDKEIQLDN